MRWGDVCQHKAIITLELIDLFFLNHANMSAIIIRGHVHYQFVVTFNVVDHLWKKLVPNYLYHFVQTLLKLCMHYETYGLL